MTAEEIIRFVSGLSGVVVLTVSEADGAPEVAWGDSFFFYDPEGDTPANRRLPFATVVIKDYPGFDTASNLNRPGIFRLNIAAGRASFADAIGYPPEAHPEHHPRLDYSDVDQVIPHPVYASQAWISILNPGEATAARARSLLVGAYERAVQRHRPMSREADRT
jgi:hypothetical protein